MLGLFERKPDLLVHSRHPYNAEPSPDRLRRTYLTAQSDFYVRTHGDIPALDAASYRLTIAGRAARRLLLSLAELKTRYATRSVTAVMQCAGNRRADMQQVRPVSGDPWGPGAIGNARWTGVSLADVLRDAGVEPAPDLHVAFASHDQVSIEGGPVRYEVSIPLAKAMAPEVLLAWAMNGEDLAPEHGFPLRAVVPGYAGVRSPKWLDTITVQEAPSGGHMQQREYKLFPPDVSEENADWDRGTVIDEMPLNAAICEPAPFAELEAGRVTIRGWANATARPIARVDVSIDSGRSWRQAELEHDAAAPWSWTLWSLDVTLPKGEHELTVRAWDGAGQTQPALPDDTWNFKGYLAASWHRIRVKVT